MPCRKISRVGHKFSFCSSEIKMLLSLPPTLPFLEGGNAGLAAAYAAKQLGIPATIVVPTRTTPLTVKKLEEHGAEVEVFGQVSRTQRRVVSAKCSSGVPLAIDSGSYRFR